MDTAIEKSSWQELWKSLRNSKCTLCPLHEAAEFVCLLGVGPVPCDYMMVGEAPGAREDQEYHKPFAGDAGHLLDSILTDAGLNRDQFFITNAARCRPPFNRQPEKSELKTCWNHYGIREFEAVKPKIVILMGNAALSVIGKTKITECRGNEYHIDGVIYLPMLHPAYALRNPGMTKYIKEDFMHFKRIAGLEKTIPDTKTVLALKRKPLEQLVAKMMKSHSVAFDLETEGLDPFIPGKRIWTIQLSDEDGIAYVVPLEHPSYLGMEWAYEVLKPLLEKIGTPIKVAHNGKFDTKWMMTRGVRPHVGFDSLQSAHLLDEERKHNLQALSQAYFSVRPWGKVKQTGTLQPMKLLAPEGAKDADYDRRLYYKQREELLQDPRTLKIFQYISNPAVNTLAEVEYDGLPVDMKKLKERSAIASEEIEKSIARLEAMTGNPKINWNSGKQKAKVLFGDPSEGGLGLPITELTAKTQQPSTAESAMKQLQNLLVGKKHEDLVPTLFNYTQWTKWKSTYFDAWEEFVDLYGVPLLHTTYNIEGTRTGRISSKEPNIQQVPRDVFIRGIIGGVDGWLILEADFSQIEMRIIAMISGDKTLRRVYLTGGDIHMETAMGVSGLPKERIDSETRKKAKAVNFGYSFGMGAEKFQTYARDKFDVILSLEEAEDNRAAFFMKYYALLDWHKAARNTAHKLGYIRSPIGRRRNLPDIYSSAREVRAEAERQAINSPVQSLASDSTVLAMNILYGQVKIPGAVELNREEIRMVATVHDSILFLVREDKVMKWAPIIKETMEHLPYEELFGWRPNVPIEVDLKIGTHWSEGAESLKIA